MSTVRARRITPQDVISVGDEVYRELRDGGGRVDRATISRLEGKDVFARNERGRRTDQVVGSYTTITTRTVYGSEQAAPRLFSSREAFDAHYPEDGSNGSRDFPLRQQQEFPVLLPDPKGDLEVEVTEDWGSSGSIMLAVEGTTPDEIRERAEKALLAEFGKDAIVGVKARPLANRRVNISVTHYERGAEPTQKYLALNVLEGLASLYTSGYSSYSVEYVDPDVHVG